jgi:hypothetical protein
MALLYGFVIISIKMASLLLMNINITYYAKLTGNFIG